MLFLIATDKCNQGSTRLINWDDNVIDQLQGRLEICYLGEWGTVCNINNDFKTIEASVVCNQLGLATNGNYTLCCYMILLNH